MPQTQIACPRCKQMITANVEQLFDVTADPGAKQRLLGGVSNVARCPYCGYEGRLATPIVYHDADKESCSPTFQRSSPCRSRSRNGSSAR